MITDISVEAQLAILHEGLKVRRAFQRQRELGALTSERPGEPSRTAAVIGGGGVDAAAAANAAASRVRTGGKR